MKKAISRIYLFLCMLFSYNPLKPRLEYLEFLSPNDKRQAIAAGMERNTQRAFSRAMGFESFDDLEESYEDEGYEEGYEELEEAYENLVRAGHRRPHSAMSAKYGRRWKGVRGGGTKKSGKTLVGRNMAGANATISITATRLTFNIPDDLPIQIFNVMDNYADNSVLRRYLPAGVVLTLSSTDATRTNWLFQFTKGALTDIVRVSCSEVSYNKLQLATQSDLFRVSKTLYKFSDELQQQTLTGKFIIVSQSLFGFGKENPLTLNNYFDPKNQSKSSIVITDAYDIDKQSGIVMTLPAIGGVIPVGYTFNINLAMSISIYSQWNKASLRQRG